MQRRRYHTRDVVVMPPVMALVFIGISVPIFLTADWREPATWIGALIAWVPVILLSVRYALLGVEVDEDTLRVRNFFRTFSLDWEEIEGFSVERAPYGGIQAAIHTTDGRIHFVTGISGSWLWSSVAKARQGKPGKIVDELNQLVQRRDSPLK